MYLYILTSKFTLKNSKYTFFFIRNMLLRLQVLLTANLGNIEENKKTQ